MKKIQLPTNTNVTFNEEEHTYTLSDGTQLSGITSIIHKYLFPCMYDGVSESVMQAARERGHETHKALEQYLFHGVAYRADHPIYPTLDAVGSLLAKDKLYPVAGEYLVSDNEAIATCIDGVMQQGDDIVLIDHKTTSVIYSEYLRWQLSIEAFLFEEQTGLNVKKLYAVHIPKNGCAKIYEVPRIDDVYVKDLINAFVSNALIFENPLHKLSEDTMELLEQYKAAELELVELKASVKYLEEQQDAIRAKIKEQMDAESASKWEKDDVVITRTKDSVRKTFKVDLLKEKANATIRKWLDKNIDKCYTETPVAGKLTIKFK